MHEVLQTQRMEFCAHDVEIGFHYDSPAVVPDGSPQTRRDPMGVRYAPTTRPGHRLPHAWLERDGQRVSTHDLCGRGRFVLFTGSEGADWQSAARAVADRYGVRIDVHRIGAAWHCRDIDGAWARLRQTGEDGAVLVRPDVHVGWRSASAPTNPAEALDAALGQILDKTLA